MKKYPSIEQFRNVIRAVRSQHDYIGRDENGDAIYEHTSDYPTLEFEGTVKLHGTNAGIVKYKDGHTEFQSREQVLSLQQDNSGFVREMSTKNLEPLFSNIEFKDYIAVYGEWCGGNIQSGVALNQLPKMFVVFGYKVDDQWIDSTVNGPQEINNQGIYYITQFPTYNLKVDFNTPELVQDYLNELTQMVEKECPVGSQLGVKGVGEGIVFTCTTNPDLKFKSKGEKHSVSNVRVLNSIDVEELESIAKFVDYAVTENRLKQGLSTFVDPTSKNTGDFLRWVVNDVFKEEEDTIVKNQLNPKKVNTAISNKARTWFLNQI